MDKKNIDLNNSNTNSVDTTPIDASKINKPTGISKVSIPKYTLGEELCNSISHGLGAVLAIIGTIFLLIKSDTPWEYVSAAIYGASMITLYSCSCLYHGLAKNNAKRVFRVIDHSVIYFLIIGTYTPFCFVTLGNTIGWVIFGCEVIIGTAGVLFAVIDLKKYGKWGMVCYILMGWIIIFTTSAIYEPLGRAGFTLLVAGGVAYTLGAVFYGIGSKMKYIHSVFHLFVILGSVLHYICLYKYVF